MKKILILFLLLVSASMAAQSDLGNFKVLPTGKIIWQQVYSTNLSVEELKDEIMLSGNYYNIVSNDSILVCRMRECPIDFEMSGYDRSTTPILILSSFVTCILTYQFKEGRYRVTAEKIHFYEDGEAYSAHFIGRSGSSLESVFINNGEIAKSFTRSNASEIIDFFFNETFAITPKPYLHDRW